jgi:cardiolipin synthase
MMFTVPNALSLLRLGLIPVFINLAGDRRDGAALLALLIASATDYLDGKAARLLNQESKLGAMLDPTIDRLYIAASLYVLCVRNIFPIWLAVILVLRDLLLMLVNFGLRSKGAPFLTVNFIGKAATFNLLYAFPLLFLSQHQGLLGNLGYIFGWAFSTWGIGLYLITGSWYFISGLKSIRFAS